MSTVEGGVGGALDGAESDPAFYVRLVSSLYITTFAVRVSFAIIFIAFPRYIEGVEGYLAYALVLAAWPVMEVSTVLGFGAAIDRRGRKRALVLGSALAAVGLALLVVSDRPVPVAMVNGLLGVAAAAILVSSLTLVADYAPRERRGREMGVFQAVQIFGWLFGFAAGGVLVELLEDDMGWVFLVSAAMCAFGALYAQLNVREPGRRRFLAEELSWAHLTRVLRQRAVVLLVLPWFVVYILVSTVFTFVFKASFEVLDLSGYELAALLGGGGALILGTFLLFGRLSDRVGRMPVMLAGTVGMVGLMVSVGLMFLTWPGSDLAGPADGHVNRFLAPIGTFAFLAGAFAPSALAYLVDVSLQRRRGITMGLYSFVISLAMAIGPIMSGAVIDAWGGAGILTFLFACGVAMLALVLLRLRDERIEAIGAKGQP